MHTASRAALPALPSIPFHTNTFIIFFCTSLDLSTHIALFMITTTSHSAYAWHRPHQSCSDTSQTAAIESAMRQHRYRAELRSEQTSSKVGRQRDETEGAQEDIDRLLITMPEMVLILIHSVVYALQRWSSAHSHIRIFNMIWYFLITHLQLDDAHRQSLFEFEHEYIPSNQ